MSAEISTEWRRSKESSEIFIKRGSKSYVHSTREFVYDRPFTDKGSDSCIRAQPSDWNER